MIPKSVIHGPSQFSQEDIYLFRKGRHHRLYLKLGSHPKVLKGLPGVCFAVWAPNADQVSVIGDFNGWQPGLHKLAVRWDGSGIWEGFIPDLSRGTLYKYHITSRIDGTSTDKGDPFAFRWEEPPRTASVVWPHAYRWRDQDWMKNRLQANAPGSAQSIYEMHLGSWLRDPQEKNRFFSYRELADPLVRYIKKMGFTHVEFLPVMEHPFYGSWGYQITGYFAPTCRYGSPEDLMYLIDRLHRNGVGVILDWVPSHFPTDEFALGRFDGSHLFEHADPQQGYHPDWKSYIFNYGRHEVQNFLISSALFWLDRFHCDGLRVDAVASMLYLDYSRQAGEWVPNRHGGRENLEAIAFIQRLNEVVSYEYPDTQTYAEESTAWPRVTQPASNGGLGFGAKWSLGWMHDSLEFFSLDPIHRKYHHDRLTFSLWYAFNENFVLPLSHDEVVYGKKSLLRKMPGDEWQKHAGLRLLLGWMYAHPGKKLLFMGGEFGHAQEWQHDQGLDWQLLKQPLHRGVQLWTRDLNRLYRTLPALSARDCSPESFEWIDFQDTDNGVVAFLRKAGEENSAVLVVCHLTPMLLKGYRIGVPAAGIWEERLNSDAFEYGGSGQGNLGGVTSETEPCHGQKHSLLLTLPPLSILLFSGPSSKVNKDRKS